MALQRKVRAVAMRPRRVLVRVHRWLSIALFAWLVVIGLTGSYLVVSDAIESWVHPHRYHVTNGPDVGIDAVVDTVSSAAGEGALVTT